MFLQEILAEPHLRKEKQFYANTVYNEGGELLTSTGDIFGQLKEYFVDLFNSNFMFPVEEMEAGDYLSPKLKGLR